MNSAKNEILSSIKDALAASAPFDAAHEAHHGDGGVLAGPPAPDDLNRQELIAMFCENLDAVGGKVSVVSSVVKASEMILQITGGKSKIAASDDKLVGEIAARLQEKAAIARNVPPAELFGCDFGLTGAQWGIAETGTLVLETGREKNRLASLIPPAHIAVLEAKNIRHGMPEILALVSDENLSRAVTFITGPSRTSDIELTLAIGVHGPAELHVIIIDEE